MYVDATIDSVRVANGEVEVTFTVQGYTASTIAVELTLARWVPAESEWLNMLQREISATPGTKVIRAGNLRLEGANAVTGGVNGTFTTKIRSPNADYGGPGAIDFSGGVVWRRPTETSASNYCNPATDAAYCVYVQGLLDRIVTFGTGWDPAATYRVGVTSRNITAVRFNAVADFSGTGTVAQTLSQEHVTLDSCAGCHSERVVLNVHGNQRHEPGLCVSCHNTFTFDAASSTASAGGWAAIDATKMIHRIHAGIDGYKVAGRDYSDVRYPDWTFGRGVGPQNCVSCHQGDVPVTAGTWNVVSYSTCTTCHVGDTLAAAFPDAPAGHATFDASTNCTTCHSETGFARSADKMHGVSAALAARTTTDNYRIRIVRVSDVVAGSAAQVVWEVVDSAGTPYAFSAIEARHLFVGVGWGYGDDWTNDGVEHRTTGARGDPWRILVNDTNTTYSGTTATTVLPALPANATAGRNGYVVIYPNEVAGTFTGIAHGSVEAKPNTAIATFTIGLGNTEAPTNQRREIVSADNCASCHATISRHGTVANDDIAACVACHNAGSLSRTAGVVQGSLDFMFMIHAIHGLDNGKRDKFERRRAFDNGGYGYATNPSTILECQDCHVNDSHKMPINPFKRIGVIADGGRAAFLSGTGVNSPQASACYSCHESGDDPLHDVELRAHMTALGGNMMGETSHAYWVGRGEGCTYCHKP